MAKIFISYRREDSQHQADRLHAALSRKMPKKNIFIDVDNIPVGVNFVQHLDQQVAQCEVLLALIGPDWLEAKNPETGKRRLDDPKDFVRIEIASALKRGIPVAPILLDGAPFPPESSLPDDLKALALRNGVEVRRMTFDTDAERLIRGLHLTRAAAAKPAPRPTPKPRTARSSTGESRWIGPAVAMGLLVIGGSAFAWFGNPGDWRRLQADADAASVSSTPPDSSMALSTQPKSLANVSALDGAASSGSNSSSREFLPPSTDVKPAEPAAAAPSKTAASSPQKQTQTFEKLSNGCAYTGEAVNGVRQGKGLYTCPNGYRYEGSYSKGLTNGYGSETLATGERYEGDFTNGVREGQGEMIFADKSSYKGGYINGKRSGSGTQKFSDGAMYSGEWKNDLRNGQGVYTTGDGLWTYDGPWVNDKRQGLGQLARVDGAYAYIGPFANDQRHGQGVAKFADGRVFRGAFVNDVQTGAAELTFKDGRKITGQFRDHVPNGQAVEISNTGTLNGVWTDGVLSGMVTVTYADGTRFEGLYANNKRNGKGTDFLKDGSKSECNWINDARQQPCARTR